MSQTTPNAPMLLDSTGQEIVTKLNGIKTAIENGGGGGGGGSCPAYLKPQAYDPSIARHGQSYTYKYGDYCDNEGTPYRCISQNGIQVDASHAFDSTEWEEVTNFINELSHKPGRIVDDEYGSESFGSIVQNTSTSNYSHAEGQSTHATGIASHAEGQSTTASGNYSHSEGSSGTTASGSHSHAEGNNTRATRDAAHSEGYGTAATGNYSHAEGGNTEASGSYSHAEGSNTHATQSYSHAEGYGTAANQSYAHAEGNYTVASGYYSHSEGYQTLAAGNSSHAEGNYTKAYGDYSHVEGYYSETGSQAGGSYSGQYAHAEGMYCKAIGSGAHAEGVGCETAYSYAHAEGYYSKANGESSHAGGNYTIANGKYEVALGSYNESSVAPPSNVYEYNENSSYYSVGSKVIYNGDGNVYECVTAPPQPAGPFDPTYWNVVDTYDTNPVVFSYGNGTYNARHNLFEIRKDGTGYFNGNPILCLAPPSSDGTYILKATVSNGVVTYSWVQEV